MSPARATRAAVRPEALEDRRLARDLGLAVGAHVLHDVALQRRQQRHRLVGRETGVDGIHVAGRDEDEVLGDRLEGGDRPADLSRLPGDVDHRVPPRGAVGHRGEAVVGVAVAAHPGGTRRHVAGHAARQARHVVTLGQGRAPPPRVRAWPSHRARGVACGQWTPPRATGRHRVRAERGCEGVPVP